MHLPLESTSTVAAMAERPEPVRSPLLIALSSRLARARVDGADAAASIDSVLAGIERAVRLGANAGGSGERGLTTSPADAFAHRRPQGSTVALPRHALRGLVAALTPGEGE